MSTVRHSGLESTSFTISLLIFPYFPGTLLTTSIVPCSTIQQTLEDLVLIVKLGRARTHPGSSFQVRKGDKRNLHLQWGVIEVEALL